MGTRTTDTPSSTTNTNLIWRAIQIVPILLVIETARRALELLRTALGNQPNQSALLGVLAFLAGFIADGFALVEWSVTVRAARLGVRQTDSVNAGVVLGAIAGFATGAILGSVESAARLIMPHTLLTTLIAGGSAWSLPPLGLVALEAAIFCIIGSVLGIIGGKWEQRSIAHDQAATSA